ncbi:hypothetical protein [Georgenia sp. SUBG003]|uniref:hypothetical protein n=1 Tax=Georgenia sp. SUBG003 TaxID=1497974 RepID=UPI003AB34478
MVTAGLAWWPGGGTAVRLALVTLVLMTWLTVAALWLRAATSPGARAATAG